ncbi:hypothetical protein QR680_008929 [Steinernema hermaphroditum]|uniref:Uncharacterized protein n=1 Tax=Steinernema hermaphroditum TaxID=289476 RepID=A0AA39IIG3_9BILA|nr:hypothetical protein QR680_008929 [Steinernema hermaphroditum]
MSVLVVHLQLVVTMPNVFKRLFGNFKSGKKDKKEEKSSGQDVAEFDREITRRRSVHFGSPRTYDYPPEVPPHRYNRKRYDEENAYGSRKYLNKTFDGEPGAHKHPSRGDHFRSLRRHRSNSVAAYEEFSDHDEYPIDASSKTIRNLEIKLALATKRIIEQDYMLDNAYRQRMKAEQESLAYRSRLQEEMKFRTTIQRPYDAHYNMLPPDSPESLKTILSGAAEVNTGMLEDERSRSAFGCRGSVEMAYNNTFWNSPDAQRIVSNYLRLRRLGTVINMTWIQDVVRRRYGLNVSLATISRQVRIANGWIPPSPSRRRAVARTAVTENGTQQANNTAPTAENNPGPESVEGGEVLFAPANADQPVIGENAQELPSSDEELDSSQASTTSIRSDLSSEEEYSSALRDNNFRTQLTIDQARQLFFNLLAEMEQTRVDDFLQWIVNRFNVARN